MGKPKAISKRVGTALGLVGLLFLLSVLSGASEASLQPGAGSITLTIYQGQNLALVEDRRTLELTQGVAEYRISGVSARLIPGSVRLEAIDTDMPEALQLLEQRFEDASLSLQQLLNAHIGQEIEVFAPGGLGTYRGRLVSTQGGVILQDDTGRLHVIKDATRFRFPSSPSSEGPTLWWLLRSELEGPQSVRLSYLTEGLDWRAEYTAVLSFDEKQLDLASWVSVYNDSGVDFERVQLNLVAGQLHRAGAPGMRKEVFAAEAEALAPPGAPFEERAAFEYHLYALRRPATLPDGQAAQLAFLQANGIPVTKRYVYEARRWDGVQVWLEFENSGPLAQPLPAGLVRLYQRTPQGLQLIGEDTIAKHTPIGERVQLFAGLAFDLIAKRTVMKFERIGDRVYRRTVRITLSNHKAESVEIAVREAMPGDWKILSANLPYEQLDAQTVEFRVPLAPGESAVVEYTVEYRQ